MPLGNHASRRFVTSLLVVLGIALLWFAFSDIAFAEDAGPLDDRIFGNHTVVMCHAECVQERSHHHTLMGDVMGYEKSRRDGLRYDRQIKEILNLFRLRQCNHTLGAKLETLSDRGNRFCLFFRSAFVAPESLSSLPPPVGRHLFEKERGTWNGW